MTTPANHSRKASKAAHSHDGEAWIDVEADTLLEAERLHSIYASAPALYAALEEILADLETADEKRTMADYDFAVYHAMANARAALSLARGGVVDGQGAGVDSGSGEKGGE